ncbi:hypothetical protein [Nocardiopsis kunsanensis]|uniref:DUF308 domain-containing protein n=1 Tax=Nocardiopsis kunsanensis TaxID=141693 RepID=A0A919CLK4_9ACTN|nr:hypothetical protein [Nocardiopsis kunsanensis]GHD36214.1 hypothetical protein GCM10007147_43410 [Nocardiopsis kunsanensis]
MTHRRENGLLADAYVPLILLSPSLADHMLEVLRRSGIAAYALPLDEDVLEPDGGGEDPPTDHLYVDAEERAAAEQVLDAELPGLEENGHHEDASDLLAPRTEPFPDPEEGADERAPGGADNAVGGDLLDGPLHEAAGNGAGSGTDDEIWKDLVARFYDTAAGPDRGSASWPDAENLGTESREDDSASDRIGDLLASRARRRDDSDDDAREEDEEAAARRAEEELEGHYEPPPPPPLLQGDKVGIAAWSGLLAAPVVLFGAAFLGISLPNWLMLAAVVAFLGGFVVLILRMTDSRPPGDNGPDDGAVV